MNHHAQLISLVHQSFYDVQIKKYFERVVETAGEE